MTCVESKNLLAWREVVKNGDKQASKVGLNVTLNPRARQVIENIRADTGIPQATAVERLLNWFGGLDWKLRDAILRERAETRAELLALVIQSLSDDVAEKLRQGPTVDGLLSDAQGNAVEEPETGHGPGPGKRPKRKP